MARIVPELRPVQVPTFQISGADMHALHLFAEDQGRKDFAALSPNEALVGLRSWLLERDSEGEVNFRPSPIGLHRQIIEKGYVGNEANQPDPVDVFLGAAVTRRFIVEQVHDQTWWDKVRKRHRIFRSYVFGSPPSMPRKID